MKKLLVIISIILFLGGILTIFIFIDNISAFLFSEQIGDSFPRYELLKVIIQSIGGFTILFGLFISIKRLNFAERNIEFNTKTLRLTQESVKNERLKNSLESIGSTASEVRIASFYSLISIAKIDSTEKETIFNILTTYLRNYTLNEAVNNNEIQILMDLLFRFENKDIFSNFKPNLEYVIFKKLNLNNSQLFNASFHGARMNQIYFNNSDLRMSYFTKAKLQIVNFDGCDLSDALVTESLFDQVSFMSANLIGVKFNGCQLHNCNFALAKGINQDTFSSTKSLIACHGIDEKFIDILRKDYPNKIIKDK